MGIQIVGPSGSVSEVGVGAAAAQHVTNKPIPYGSLGHYRSTVRFAIVNTQAAGSRLWEIRNTHATNLIIPTRLEVRWLQLGAHTAAIRDSLQLFFDTAFTAVDTTNTVTPTVSAKRTSMAAPPGGAAIRHVTVAGVAAGMTGGTRTPNGGFLAAVEQWFTAAQPTAGTVVPMVKEMLDDVNGTHPLVLVQNEGLELQNEVLLGAAASSSVVVDFSWAEVSAF